MQLKVVNIVGQKVFEQTISGSQLNHIIDLSKLAKGVYEVVLEENKATATKKLVIQ